MSPHDALHSLLHADRVALARRFASGARVSASRLRDRRFRGVSLGLPRVVERATWKLFAKDIVDDGGVLRGWNVRLQQPRELHAHALLGAPLIPLERRGHPFTFAPFLVIDDEDGALIDYRAAPNPFPLSTMVDPLRDIGGGVLLGVSDLCVGGGRHRAVRTPTWFALIDHGPVPSGLTHAA